MTGSQLSAERHRIRRNAVTKADSVMHTYNQHFLAANFYRWLNRFLDTVLFGASLALATQVIWEVWPFWAMVVLPLGMALITGYRRAAKPDRRAEEFRKSANRHHALFDKFRDFLTITLPSDGYTDEEVRNRFDGLSVERRELNQDGPDASSLWYYWIKYVRGEEMLQKQISTTREMRAAIAGDVLEASED